MPYYPQVLKFALYLALSSSLVSGFSFTFTSQPQQCADLSLQITGSGTPPYSVLIIPYGPSPLPNNIEARTIVYQEFSGDSSSVSFQLKYPTNSQRPLGVVLVSDSTGFGSGGTSVAASVMESSDSSCYNATQNVSPDFPFNISPPNQVVQCSPSRLWWNSNQVQGTPNFQGVIPGGQSFSISVGQVTQVSAQGSGFDWTPSVRAGSTLMIVAGDNRGLGTGGSEPYNVQAGLNPNNTCLTNNSPSSTAGPPAGGAYPTNASGDETSGGASSNDTGAIVGGVIGGLAAIVILALAGFYIIRRRTSPRSQKERPVDLLQGDPDDNEPPHNTELPQYYHPEPFLATAPTEVSSAYAQEDGGRRSFVSGSNLLHDSLTASRYGTSDRRQSGLTTFSDPRSATPELDGTGAPSGSMTGLTSSRKSPMPRQLRPVNIIQHEDAGLGNPEEEQAETIELPPAYTNIRKAPEQS
ncbi:hypothetical protein PAXRUDRAFT_11361 [Paxillus rubicundulus Ve08.2h10]|uniref:Unplaced genomic scaffold scaffold_212, whole genome shotgun sequence n=1 Tax=Paxillus rubicundulus Ve08.2h10 TaxID=930991 RepID=A0A0D0DRF4_9AGAM|nr:hypothetical protein PAXRUDRAFT_11361 [Paxillus rubicundulus Ve08.2h10]